MEIRIYRVVAISILAALFLAQSMAYSAPKSITLGLSLESLANQFYAELKDAAIDEARKLNVDIVVLGVAHTTDIEGQVRIIEDFITKKVDLIGYMAVDSRGVVSVLQKAKKAGIPIISVDTQAEWDGDVTFISTDNVVGGFLAGTWLANAIGGEGKVAVIEGSPSTVNADRKEGFYNALKMYPKVKVVVEVPANWRRDMGMSVTEDVLTGYPDIKGLFFLRDEMALGGLEAIRARRLQDKIRTIGYDGIAEAIQEVYKGRLGADVVQFPEVIGREFVRWAVRVLNGETPPKFINTGVAVADTALLQKSVPICLEVQK